MMLDTWLALVSMIREPLTNLTGTGVHDAGVLDDAAILDDAGVI